ncbi:MAG: hypothetical protein AB7T07_13080 [Steroidobacteraceae bacterium]
MKGLLFGLLAAAAMTPGHPSNTLTHAPVVAPLRASIQSTPVVSEWVFNGQADAGCQLQTEGQVTDESGAALNLYCAQDTPVLGNVLARLPAQGWRQRRVTISAEIRAGAAMNASLWLKTQHDAATLMFDDDSEQNLLTAPQSEDGWVHRSVTLPVAADATQISFGVLLQGAGELSVRAVQLNFSEPGAIVPEAAQWLDAAIGIVKQHTLQRHDLSWPVLEPQLRLFASGAQTPADVYPAIKYLLSRLGDKQSLLLTPEVALALNRGSATTAATDMRVNVFVLPDGAQLVLSRTPAETAVRTAQNLPQPAALP